MLRSTGSEHAESQGRLLFPSSSSPRTCGTEWGERSAANGWHSPDTHPSAMQSSSSPPSPPPPPSPAHPDSLLSSDSRVTHPSGWGSGWGDCLGRLLRLEPQRDRKGADETERSSPSLEDALRGSGDPVGGERVKLREGPRGGGKGEGKREEREERGRR